MNTAYDNLHPISFFSEANEAFNSLILHLSSSVPLGQEHGAIEHYIHKEGYELLRCLLQAHLDLRASLEPKQTDILNSRNKPLNHCRSKTQTTLTSLFGDVTVTRKGYNQRKEKTEYPLDKELSLATDQYSDGVKLQVIHQASHIAYDHVVEHLSQVTGAQVAKRQCLNIVQDCSQDFDSYYSQNRYIKPEPTTDLLVLTFDGKGIIMRPDSLRECTKKKAKKSHKLNARLSAGEKRDRKRMAQVASVYSVLPHPRNAASIIHKKKEDNVHDLKAPARNKRVWASVEHSSEDVIRDAFKEALQRDPEQKRKWVVVIDGQPSQRKIIERVAKELEVEITIVMDFIHVLEYIWKAAWCFFDKGDEAVEKWVSKYAVKILEGKCSQVAKGLRQSATKRGVEKRHAVDKCADYLLKNKTRLKYDEALKSGFPIASGIIEGACRHLINDRLDVTGARWGLKGAEAILKLRSLKSSGDLDEYWAFHKQQANKRNYRFKLSPEE